MTRSVTIWWKNAFLRNKKRYARCHLEHEFPKLDHCISGPEQNWRGSCASEYLLQYRRAGEGDPLMQMQSLSITGRATKAGI